MTPKNNSPSDLKPEDIYVFDNEDVNDISEAPEHLEISPSAEIFMEILKLKTPGVILHSVNNKALVLTHLVRGNEYRIKNHPMVKAIKVQPAKEASESDENNKVEDPMLKVPILYDPKKLSEKLEAHPHTPAVLIKGQGLFVWAKDFDECILRTEALHQMFEFSIEMKKLGLTEQTQNAQNKSQIKKPAENGPKKTNSITPAQASAIAKTNLKSKNPQKMALKKPTRSPQPKLPLLPKTNRKLEKILRNDRRPQMVSKQDGSRKIS